MFSQVLDNSLRRMKSYCVNRSRFSVPSRYNNIRYLFKGAYGTVVCAVDRLKKERVAIKKCRNVLHIDKCDREQSFIYLERMYKELEILIYYSQLNNDGSDNLIKMKDMYYEKNDVYLVFEYKNTDLRDAMTHPSFLLNTRNVRKRIIYELLKGIDELTSAGICHRDLKPRNILLDMDDPLNPQVKICDFGLSTSAHKPEKSGATVVTRWYRPLELLLDWEISDNHTGIDMWSFGCIAAEILMGRPLFPGGDVQQTVELILRRLGSPSNLGEVTGCKHAVEFVRSLDIQKEWDRNFDRLKHSAYDLISKCLAFDPEKRISPSEALQHSFFDDVRFRGGECEQKNYFSSSSSSSLRQDEYESRFFTPVDTDIDMKDKEPFWKRNYFVSSFNSEWNEETIREGLVKMMDRYRGFKDVENVKRFCKNVHHVTGRMCGRVPNEA